jgi:hypothetical protein
VSTSAPRAQGGTLQQHYRQAVIEVGAELPCRDPRVEVRLGGGHHLHIHHVLSYRTDAAHALRLNRRQELTLEEEGEGINLVQQQRSLLGSLKEAGFWAFGIGKCAGLKAKHFRLQEHLRNGGTVHLDKGALGPRAALMDEPRHEPLARAGFPLEQ